MHESLVKGECKGCGNHTFRLHSNAPQKRITVECTLCGELSHIQADPIEIKGYDYEGYGANESTEGMLRF